MLLYHKTKNEVLEVKNERQTSESQHDAPYKTEVPNPSTNNKIIFFLKFSKMVFLFLTGRNNSVSLQSCWTDAITKCLEKTQGIQHKAVTEQVTEFLCEQKSTVINKYANSSLMLCHETNSSQMLSEL